MTELPPDILYIACIEHAVVLSRDVHTNILVVAIVQMMYSVDSTYRAVARHKTAHWLGLNAVWVEFSFIFNFWFYLLQNNACHPVFTIIPRPFYSLWLTYWHIMQPNWHIAFHFCHCSFNLILILFVTSKLTTVMMLISADQRNQEQ